MIKLQPVSRLVFVVVFVSVVLLTFSRAQFCDQRETGGRLLCCKGTDHSCYVRVSPTGKSPLPKGQTICYCDEYCQATGDCCPDLKQAGAQCGGAQDCVVSAWSSWSKCSVQCGFGTMKRIRLVVQAPKNGGKPCPSKIEKKGCFRHRCEGNMILAQILPAKYRRLDFGSYEFEKILPDKKTLTAVEKTRIRFRSHCVKFKLMSKHPYCKDTTWASKLKMSKLMCVECQPAIMDNQGFCKGEGIVGNFTSWMATGSRECSGLWMRVGEKIPDCKCDDNDNQNFIFV